MIIIGIMFDKMILSLLIIFPPTHMGLHLLGKFSWKDRGVGKFSFRKSEVGKIRLELEITDEVRKFFLKLES